MGAAREQSGAAGQDGKDGKDGFDGSNFDDSQIQAELLILKDADTALENRINAIKAPTIIQDDSELNNFTEAGSFSKQSSTVCLL